MAKKRKTPALRTLDKAFAIAANFPSKAPEHFKTYLTHFRQTKKEIIDILQMDSLWDVPKITPEVISFFCTDDMLESVMRYRDLLLEFWRREKKCYEFTEETLAFINEKICPEKMDINTGVVFRFACSEPIYIEFPRNSDIRGVFCGCTRMLDYNTHLPLDKNKSILVTAAVFGNQSAVALMQLSEQYVSDLIRETEPDEKNHIDMRLIYKAIAYLGYIQSKCDSKGTVIVPSPRHNCESFQVHPIQYLDWLPEYIDADPWLTVGFAPLCNFLSRGNMLKDIANQLAGKQMSKMNIFSNTPNEIKTGILKAILEWEASRVIYQYNKDTADLLFQKSFANMVKDGIPSSKLNYLPSSSIALYLNDIKTIFLMTVASPSDSDEKMLITFMVKEEKAAVQAVGFDCPYTLKETLGNEEWFLRAYCTLMHLLETLEKNALKRQLKLQIQQGNPNTTSLAIIPPKPTPTPDIPKETPPPITLRQGAPIEEIPLNLFNITTKGIKRASRAETEKYTKWKMAPHTRRQHVHHYWVGTGADRHLEARVLAPIKINYSDDTPPITTIREIK